MTEVTQMMDILKSQSSEIIIISDANSVFISELLDAANLTSYITKVFTNPAYFDDVRSIAVEQSSPNWISKLLLFYYRVEFRYTCHCNQILDVTGRKTQGPTIHTSN